jgi:hypothetical protein
MVIADWSLFDIVRENAVNELFGSYTILALVMLAVFLIILIGVGIEFRFAILFSLPVAGGFFLAGWFSVDWIFHVFIMIGAIIYAYALIKLFSS